MTVDIQAAAPADLPAILQLNQQAVPLVNSLTPQKLAGLAGLAAHFSVARLENRVAGFLIALPHTANYPSHFFNWFCQRYTDFIYIDRIVVAGESRRQGIGLALLADAETFTVGRGCSLASDLYASNTESLAFHQKFGFESVGEQTVNTTTVIKLLKWDK